MEKEELYLYHLTLQKQSNYVNSCIGHFVSYKQHQLVAESKSVQDGGRKRAKARKALQLCIATQTHLELYDVEEGTLYCVMRQPMFATILCMETLVVENRTFLILVSDSGNLTICNFVYRDGKCRLETLSNEPMGRSGVRRLSPQTYLSVNPQGRCLMLSAMERNKVCYLIDFRGDELQVSSPLEANRPNFVTIQTVCCDVGFDNPLFASLEIDLVDKSRYLFFYMLDLGLKHVAKLSEYVLHDSTASFIVAVPNLEPYGIVTKQNTYDEGNTDEIIPFVIVCFENYISLRDLNGMYDINVQIPTRRDAQRTLITACTVHKLRNDFFVLLQSNYGDLYKVRILPDNKDKSPTMLISYFDTIPHAEKFHIFKNGYMFSNSELGNSYLYLFENLGEESEQNTLTSHMPGKRLLIEPHDELENLSVADKLDLINPVTSSHVSEAVPLTVITKTLGATKTLKAGIELEEIISSRLPSTPLDIWTTALNNSKFHRLLFLALPKSTMILKIADGTVEELELEMNPFSLSEDRTLLIGSMGAQSIIQVCENKLIQVAALSGDKYISKLEWFPPAGIRILDATCSNTQLVLALSNNEIVYFEIGTNDSLNELQDRIELEDTINGLSVANGMRSNYLVVVCGDTSVKVYSLKMDDQNNFFEVVSMQALTSSANSIKLVSSNDSLCLHIGLASGVYVRSRLDKHDGQLFDVRTKYLGSKPVDISFLPQMFPFISDEEEEDEEEEENNDKDRISSGTNTATLSCVILHSNKTWVSYELDSVRLVRPLILARSQSLKKVAPFTSNEIKLNGFCSISSAGTLVIGRLGKFNTLETWFELNAQYGDDTTSNNLKQLEESDDEQNEQDRNGSIEKMHKMKTYFGRCIVPDIDDENLLYIVDNYKSENFWKIYLMKNELYYKNIVSEENYQKISDYQVISAVIIRFGQDLRCLVVSTRDNKLVTFQIQITKKNQFRYFQLIHVHDTPIDEQVHAMVAFGDKILVPISNALVLYGMGKKRLLKKSITLMPPSITKVVSLDQWKSQRIAVGDIHESVTLFHFDKPKNMFIPVADDTVKRHVTTLRFLDECTVIGGDRFSNIWVLRLPLQCDKLIKEDFEGHLQVAVSHISKNIKECNFKWKLLNHFYLNDIPISLQTVSSAQFSDRTNIIYTGLQGTVGCIIPLITRREVELFESVEQVMRDADYLFYLEQEERFSVAAVDIDEYEESLGANDTYLRKKQKKHVPEGAYSTVGRDILSYRSYYNPVRHVIDGDLCERFFTLHAREKKFLVSKLESKNTVDDIESLINNIRTNCL
ncbi:U2 snRNP complex subunit RSE1 Ecym_3168 [Eremothecium cymbalariae DBVPG|uniref:Cleavage/polyadenylation specificity factor A subunit C-terminal domain-containing protein n=1 Tax=Eremothecium cymbalariae (strain CBS 270.75 / DBVPG 7215 / KCTC 17166 / NRRL Y-17582) TaxID=931890 RepID=G8JRA1_ERECY|nr:Hypothetical protein Ecym_3168 [Eremothecium cymbalariae DBVPG\